MVAAEGTNAEGTKVSDDDDATVRITDVAPSISVVKTADPVSLPEPGGDVVFTVTVENKSVSSDPVTLTSLVDSLFGDLVDDAANGLISDSNCALGEIAPGATYDVPFQGAGGRQRRSRARGHRDGEGS